MTAAVPYRYGGKTIDPLRIFPKFRTRSGGGGEPARAPSRSLLRLVETALRPGTYPFSSDQGSQAGLGSISTRLSDRPGTLSAVVFFAFIMFMHYDSGVRIPNPKVLSTIVEKQPYACTAFLRPADDRTETK